MKLVTKSKTRPLASNALLGASKRLKRRVCQDPTPSDAPSDSDTELAVPLADDSTEEDEEQDADGVFFTGRSLKTTVEKSEYDERNISDGRRTHFMLAWREILFMSIVRDKHCVVLILYNLELQFFKFCNYSLCFLCQLFTFPN
jgi:hypothetical protein